MSSAYKIDIVWYSGFLDLTFVSAESFTSLSSDYFCQDAGGNDQSNSRKKIRFVAGPGEAVAVQAGMMEFIAESKKSYSYTIIS
ncbi:hypothetical protein AgCh_025273 [Apium graveolens]